MEVHENGLVVAQLDDPVLLVSPECQAACSPAETARNAGVTMAAMYAAKRALVDSSLPDRIRVRTVGTCPYFMGPQACRMTTACEIYSSEGSSRGEPDAPQPPHTI